MARAHISCLHALFLLLCFNFCSISSIHAHPVVSPSLNLDFSQPTAILVFPAEAASISERPDGSKAHITGRVPYVAKKLPPWEDPTGEMVSFITSNLSFRTIADQNSSSCTGDAMSFLLSYSTPTIPHGHRQTETLVSRPFQNSTTRWNTDHNFACFINSENEDRSRKLVGIDVESTEDTATAPPSKKNSSSVLLPRVPYLASPAAASSFNHSGSYHHHHKFLGMNANRLHYLDLSASSGGFVGFRNLTGCRITLATLWRYSLPYKYKRRTRRLLSGRYGRRSTRELHVANRGKAASSWLNLEQAAVAASALIGSICAVAALVLCCIRSRRKQQSTAAVEPECGEHIELRRASGPREFSCSELAVATGNFAEERKIGRGGFGPVYRGYFTDQDRHVAIKTLSEEQSVQGLREFQAEVTVLSQLRHRNIVHLVGWCGRRRELALVYELMPGGSLDTHLYNSDKHLTWSQRYKIALGLGTALRYLHAECEQCVVHGDIKPANVMLDASYDAKLGDFGLARLVPRGAEPRTTQVVAGTVGYIDPEFVSSRRPSAESDVYSFGVVLLEIACGRRPTTARRSPGQASAAAALLASVRELHRRNLILDAADRRLGGEFDRLQMERLLVTGLWCAHRDPMRRPSVTQAIDVLRSQDAKLPVLEAMSGSGEIHSLEEQAYGDLSDDLHESTETAYLTTEE